MFGLVSCGGFNLMNGANPGKRAFKYYDKNFTLDSSTKLRIASKYFLVTKNGVDILVFQKDGFLNNHYTNDISGAGVDKVESGAIMGYYKLKQDSIFFTTKSYYQHRATFYKGLIKNDTLDLEVKSPNYKKAVREKYVLYKS
ncbi:MAG TPA: hypothetical protein VF008_00410 [Niastella sp.]